MESDLSAAREELERLTNENLRLLDRLDAATQDRTQLWKMTTEAISQERAAYQSAINQQWQQRGFGTPYPEAPHIPPNAAPKTGQDPIIPRRPLGSEEVARRTKEFARDLADKLAQ